MLQPITWSLASSGAARCRGAPCGRGRHKTAWIIWVWHMWYLRRWERRIWGGGSHLGPFDGRYRMTLWNHLIRGFDGCALGHALVHHYRVFRKGNSHVSLRGDYLTQIRTFVTQSAAKSRWSQHEDTGQSSPALDSLCSPRNIRRRESDEESPCKSRCRTRRVEDVLAVMLSPVAVSARDPDAIIYDCRPPILPVSIRMKGLLQTMWLFQLCCRVWLLRQEGWTYSAEIRFQSGIPSRHSCQDFPVMLALIWRTSSAVFSRFRRRSPHCRNPVWPICRCRRLGSFCDADVSDASPEGAFPSDYVCFPDVWDVPGCVILWTGDFASDSCSTCRFGLCLAGGSGVNGQPARGWHLVDGWKHSDLPLLPLLPLPGSSPTAFDTQFDSVPADLSREGTFEVLAGASIEGEVPMVLNSLLGCPYRMTWYHGAEIADVDPVYGLQLHHPRFLEYVGAPESARLLTRPPGTLGSNNGAGGGSDGCFTDTDTRCGMIMTFKGQIKVDALWTVMNLVLTGMVTIPVMNRKTP